MDFGSSFGLKAKSLTSKTANPATAGYLLLAKTDAIEWRNNANSGNLALTIDGSDMLNFNGSPLGLTSLTNTHIYVGNASNVPVDVAMSGDATLANTGAMTIANSAITNVKVSASAAIALSKLAATTVSKALVSDSGGLIAPSSVTSTELGYLSGVTSAIQAQIGTLLPLAGGTMSGAINMASNKITSVTNGSNAGDAVAYNQLRVIQTVSSATGSTFTSTSVVFASILTATITPTSASNRILITASMPLSVNGAGSGYASLFQNSTNLATVNSPVHQAFAVSSVNGYAPCAMTFVDSPATTSAITYSLRTAADGSHAVGLADGVATLTVQEIV